MQEFDFTGGYPPKSPDAPATVTLPAEWLRDYPGLFARLCIARCQQRHGGHLPTLGQVQREAGRILPGYALSRSAARRGMGKCRAEIAGPKLQGRNCRAEIAGPESAP